MEASCKGLWRITAHLPPWTSITVDGAAKLRSLAGWLRSHGVRNLCLYADGYEPASVPAPGQPAALQSLCLSGAVGLDSLPPWLPSCSQLSSLRVSKHMRDWASLAGCSALTKLELSGCDLPRLPEQLAGLGQLQALSLSINRRLGEARDQQAAWAALAACTALTELLLSSCGLARLPGQLSALGGLCKLELWDNERLGGSEDQQAAWAPLAACTTLMELHLSGCGLARLPGQLAALGQLRGLRLNFNVLLGRARDQQAAWAALAACAALTELCLSGCALARLPRQLSALGQLRMLDLSLNTQLGQAENQRAA